MSTTSTTATTATSRWRDAAVDLGRSWGPVGIYVGKTVAAALVTLWVAFRTNFPEPYDALVTLFIVSMPVSGMVLQKSFYRLLGTLVGFVASILIMGLFLQHRVLFIGAMALWAGLCAAGGTYVAGSSYFRNYHAYGFVLAGYTAVLIGFEAVLEPNIAPIHLAVDRTAVVALGILGAGVFSDGLFPQRMSAQLIGLVRRLSADLYRAVADALVKPLSEGASAERHQQFIASTFQFESNRSAAVFESPDVRLRNARLQRLNAHFMVIASTLNMLERRRRRLGFDNAVAVALRPVTDELAVTLAPYGEAPFTTTRAEQLLPRLRGLRDGWPKRLAAARASVPADLNDHFDDTAQVLQQQLTELISYTEARASLRYPRVSEALPRLPYRASIDPLLMLVNGIRTAVALSLVSVFWVLTGWPDGPFAIIICAAIGAISSTFPDPRAPLRSMMVGFSLGFAGAVVCTLWLLPMASGFAMLALAWVPFVIPGLIAQTSSKPNVRGGALGYLIMLAIVPLFANTMQYSATGPTGTIGVGISVIAGVAAALVSFTLIPDQRVRSVRRSLLRLRQSIADLCVAPMHGLRHRFESTTRDLIQYLPQPPKPEIVAAVLAALELGNAILHLRRAVGGAASNAEASDAGDAVLAAVRNLLLTPGGDAELQRTVRELEDARRALEPPAGTHKEDPAAARVRIAIRRLGGALADARPAVVSLRSEGLADGA